MLAGFGLESVDGHEDPKQPSTLVMIEPLLPEIHLIHLDQGRTKGGVRGSGSGWGWPWMFHEIGQKMK